MLAELNDLSKKIIVDDLLTEKIKLRTLACSEILNAESCKCKILISRIYG